MSNACRDCKRCVESPMTRFLRVLFNVCTLGVFALLGSLRRSVQKTCRICGHPIAFHSVVDGRFKD